MNPAISKLLTATPEQRQEILSRLKPEELAQVFKELENIENSPTRRWYCTRETCDGRPHAGFHWCDHPIDSENHTPWCNHSRTPQRPPVEEPMNPWLVWFFSGGRGTGKTRAGAEWVLDLVWNQGYKRIALVGRTPADVRDVMIFGDALALDTPVPTPTGWTTMGELKEGDTIIGGDGQPCKVTYAFPIMQDRPCYKVTLANGAEIIADEKHKWLTESAHERRMRYSGSVRTTKELHETLYVQPNNPKARRSNHAIRLPKHSEFGELQTLPIDPYVLGAWLGDGTSKWGAITSMDSEIIERIKSAGYECRMQKDSGYQGRAHTYGILKLGAQLRELGLLKNKHIPEAYLRSTYHERLSLLQGLMDTDGFISQAGQCEFTQKDETIALQVLELVSSLGIKATFSKKIHHGVVGDGNTHHRITFTTTLPVFHLSRKLLRLPTSFRDEGLLHVRSVQSVLSVPVRCISVDSPDRTYMVGKHFVPTHNSGIMSVSDPHPRPQHEPTKRRLVWPNGAQAFTYSAAAPSQLRGPQHDAAWCVAEGELVATHRGEIPIEQVQVGDSVWTRNGLRRVLATTLTNPCAEIMEIHDNEGRVLRCTPNHRVFVNGEWCLAENVTPSDTLVVWKSSSAHQHGNNGMEALGDYLKTGITKTKREASCTSACGNSTTVGESNQAKSSTTLTKTKATTTRQTCKSCHEQTTYDSTWTSVDTISLQTVPSAQTLYGKNASQKMSYANNAVPPIKASVCEQSFVAESVATNTCVSAVFRNGQTAAVYDLTVEGEHEFFASGILVHNCDELAAWTDAPKGDVLDTSWNNLMLGLRLPGHNPKCLVTTTPKRVKLVRQVMERKSTVITNGTTYENLHNMAAAFREQVLQAYEGTRIGRQELDGVLLTDVDGALWNLEMIDENRGRFVYSTRGGSDD